jgi:hypothetical protein
MRESDTKNEPLALDYFAGDVPALAVFIGSVEDVIRLLNHDHGDSQRRLYELCYVGAVIVTLKRSARTTLPQSSILRRN